MITLIDLTAVFEGEQDVAPDGIAAFQSLTICTLWD